MTIFSSMFEVSTVDQHTHLADDNGSTEDGF
jgi:hypothetical protein